MRKRKFNWTLLILSIILLATLLLCLCWGSYQLTVQEVFQTLIGKGNKLSRIAVLEIRLPRILVGAFVAVALSLAGSILQTITKNDLADTGIIGINAGAAIAAVIFIFYQTVDYYSELGSLSIFVLPLMAILGAGITATVIYLLSGIRGFKPVRLLLIGLGINAGLNALITFMTFRGGVGDYNRVLVWTSGSLWGAGWSYAKVIIPIVLVMYALIRVQHKKLDVLTLSNELSTSLGLNIERERRKFLIYTVILAGSATAFAGNISFIGLIAPHIAKRLVGPYHRYFMIISAMISAIIVLLADAVSRNLFSPIEIPVGITVSIIGVPYFIYLMMKE